MSFAKGSLFACNPTTARLQPTKLSTDPKGEKVVYVNGRTVIIRDLNDPTKAISYSQHTQNASVARISPSGYYCASADVAGTVRIWDIAGTDQVLKLEAKPFAGKINDIAWDGESKRMIAVGEGKEKFGATFLVDSGSSCGEIVGSSKAINAVSVRHQRPFRAATASDDMSIVFFTGVPFKYDKIIKTHTKYVQDIKFSHSGDHFASVGSDGQLFLYDGKDGSTLGGIDAHKGTILATSWSPDSKFVSTAGADGLVKLWDIATKQVVQEYTIGTGIESQQNGNVWASENAVVSISLDGTLNVIDPRVGDKWRTLHGPAKAITATTYSTQPEPTFYAGSFDGSVSAYSIPSGECKPVTGSGPQGQVTGLAVEKESNGKVWASAWGSAGVTTIEAGLKFGSSNIQASSPYAIAAASGLVYTACPDGVLVSGKGMIPCPGGCTAIAAQGDLLAFGGPSKKVHLGTVSGGTLHDGITFDDSRGELLSLIFSPDSKLLAAGDSSGRIVLIDVKEKKVLVSSKWTAHTGRVGSLAFSPDSLRLASASLDESIYIWSVTKTLRNVAIKNAHAGGSVGVAWQDDETIITAGADACVRTWKISGI